jgi:DNA-binding NarL/FixJ family response regulator
MSSLNERQIAVCKGIAQGKLDKQIAAELGISIDLLCYHKKQLFRKSGAHSRTELALWFLFMDRKAAEKRLGLQKRFALPKAVTTRR